MRKVALFVGILLALSMCLSTAKAADSTQIAQAIDHGLAWLAGKQNPDSSWGISRKVGKTGLVVKKFEHDAIRRGHSTPFDPAYLYHQEVETGLAYILKDASIVPISGDADTDGDTIGVCFSGGRTYETGIALMAIAESNSPNRVVNDPGSAVNGWTYYQVAEDVMNWLAFAQADAGLTAGGWGYSVNSGGDQSNSGYATFGLGFVEAPPPHGFNIVVPQFVKDRMGDSGWWVDYIQDDVGVGDPQYDGGSACYRPNQGDATDVNILETGNLLFEMAWYGDDETTQRVQDAIAYIVRAWSLPGVPIGGWWSDYQGWHGNYHAMFTLMKGLEAFGITMIDAIDWFDEVTDSIVATKNANGSWGPDYWDDWTGGDTVTSTCWALFTLQKVTRRIENPSNVFIPNTEECVNPGDYVCLPILLDNNTTPFGGFELEVEFDYTAMTFVGAEPGELIVGFEKFTYRLLPCPACGCCKYKILLYGQYDLPNGVENIGDPIPITPPGEYGELVNLCFVVNNDENLRGLKIPVCFEWEGEVVNDTLVEDWNCEENTFSSWSGDTLFTSNLLCQFNPEICDDPADRIQPILIFQDGICGQNCGGVDVCPAGPGVCKRGDVNYNTITYEVADAVLFASYFVEGTSVFRYDLAYQICATDVNADGRTLTLSDLVYLIRVILQDAVELPKPTPSSEVVNVIVSGGTISTECAAPIGAILFEFDGAFNPTLLADMEMLHKDRKVLVWSKKGNSFSTAEVLSFTGEAKLVNVSAVDRDSRELTTNIAGKVAPITFALHRAYPNPFNPYTNLSFTLPEAASYSLKIYNVTGQLVRSYEDIGSAGLNTVTWDSRDNVGNELASGVYFYKLTAGNFSATEKMVLMK